MGVTHTIAAAKPALNGRWHKPWKAVFLVDSGASVSVVPGKVLRTLGIKPYRRDLYERAGGSLAELDIGLAFLTVKGITVGSEVAAGATLDGRNILPRLEPDVVMARIEFDAGGRALRLFDNALYTPELLGPEFILDARSHPTPTPLLSYVTESYGVSIGNRFGFASPITVLAGGIPAGRGVAYAWGTVEGDRLTGQYGYQVEVYLPGTVFGDGAADQYSFFGLRE